MVGTPKRIVMPSRTNQGIAAFGIESLLQDDSSAQLHEWRKQDVPSARVIQRHVQKADVVLRQLQSDGGVEGVPVNLPVGDHGPFGSARRPGRIEDHGDVVLTRLVGVRTPASSRQRPWAASARDPTRLP